MATMRLIPSTYYLSSSSYLSVSNATNMYTNTDSTNYATVTNSRTSTTSYYIYVRGFNFDDIPSNAVVSDFTIKLKGNYSGGYSQTMNLYDGTSTSMGSASSLSTTVSTHEFITSYSWEQIVNAGSDFGIRINCRRASRNTTSYIYIYGAEIEVTYTVPNPRAVAVERIGDGTIDPVGANTYYDGDEIVVTAIPTDQTATVTATRDGSAITLTKHTAGSSTNSAVLGEYTLESGGFNGSGASYFEGIVGNGVDASKTTSNYYSSGSGTQAIFRYAFDFTDIPANATITRVYCQVNGHAESTSNSSEYMCVQLVSGTTELTEQINYKSIGTSNTTVTLECETLPTVDQIHEMQLECVLGYYGGAINGATCYVEWETDEVYYTYEFVVSGDTTIVVTFGGSTETDKIYFKNGTTWTVATQVYKKVNGTWVLQSNLQNVFDANTNYVRGGV